MFMCNGYFSRFFAIACLWRGPHQWPSWKCPMGSSFCAFSLHYSCTVSCHWSWALCAKNEGPTFDLSSISGIIGNSSSCLSASAWTLPIAYILNTSPMWALHYFFWIYYGYLRLRHKYCWSLWFRVTILARNVVSRFVPCIAATRCQQIKCTMYSCMPISHFLHVLQCGSAGSFFCRLPCNWRFQK